MTLEKEYQRALAASSKKKTAKPALSRYGYLVIQWPIIEDEIEQSGGGPIMLGQEDELTISRSSHPKSNEAKKANLERLQSDVKQILKGKFSVISHNGYLFLKPR